MKAALVSLLAVVLAALLEVCTGWLRDANGLPTVDLVLVVTVAAAAWKGPGPGLLCGLVGGLMVGGPGGVPASTAVVYASAGAMAGLAGKGALGTVMTQTVAIAVVTTLVLSRAMTPQVWHNAVLVLLTPLARHK